VALDLDLPEFIQENAEAPPMGLDDFEEVEMLRESLGDFSSETVLFDSHLSDPLPPFSDIVG